MACGGGQSASVPVATDDAVVGGWEMKGVAAAPHRSQQRGVCVVRRRRSRRSACGTPGRLAARVARPPPSSSLMRHQHLGPHATVQPRSHNGWRIADECAPLPSLSTATPAWKVLPAMASHHMRAGVKLAAAVVVLGVPVAVLMAANRPLRAAMADRWATSRPHRDAAVAASLAALEAVWPASAPGVAGPPKAEATGSGAGAGGGTGPLDKQHGAAGSGGAGGVERRAGSPVRLGAGTGAGSGSSSSTAVSISSRQPPL